MYSKEIVIQTGLILLLKNHKLNILKLIHQLNPCILYINIAF